MKFTAIFAIIITLAVTSNAATVAVPAPLEEHELNARACVSSSCLCNKIQGQFCGNEAINKACTNGHVFECNGNTGQTCDYGIRTSCVQCGQLSC